MLLPQSAYNTIQSGQIAILPNFIPPPLIQSLRSDALDLFQNNHFATDALATYGTEATTKFDPSRDRTVTKLSQWSRRDIGDPELRMGTLGSLMGKVRSDLAWGLDRPGLDGRESVSTTGYGVGSTEISYTRFGPGAFLKRHNDEHHEELKGIRGWEKPTRRSISWLIYLNEDNWNAELNGGHLRCFQRTTKPNQPVGSAPNGDLQIGWIRADPRTGTPTEQPVFLDGRMSPTPDGNDANCAMYILPPPSSSTPRPIYISRTFHPNPVLFLSGGDFFARRLLIDNPALAPRFHFVEPPRSVAYDLLRSKVGGGKPPVPSEGRDEDESVLDVPPFGGTLVMFDSVSLPHEVLPSWGRDRWAVSGWFHEDQQEPHRGGGGGGGGGGVVV